jgi:nucleoside-diphosphate-sugar epimerase
VITRGVVNLSIGDLYRAESLAQLSHMIQTNQSFGDEPLEYWHQELILPHHCSVDPFQCTGGGGDAVILVGATGFLGTGLVEALVSRFSCVICVARRPECVVVPASFVSRVRIYAGDIEKPLLGLSREQWSEIASHGVVGMLFNACVVNYTLPYAALRAPNVMGCLEGARVARAMNVTFWYVSSASAKWAPVTPQQLVRSPASGYAKTKVVCETLLLQMPSLTLRILRPGAIGSDSRNGSYNSHDMHIIVAHRSLVAHCVPVLEARASLMLKWIPVDECARVIADCIRNNNGSAPISLNIESSGGPSAYELFSALLLQAREQGEILEEVPVELWKKRLLVTWRDDPLSDWVRDLQLYSVAKGTPTIVDPTNTATVTVEYSPSMLVPLAKQLCLATKGVTPPIPRSFDLERLMERLRLWDPKIDDRILNVYQLGSRVYGTAHADSDWDFMIVASHNRTFDRGFFLWECFDDGACNAAIYSVASFEHMLAAQRLEAVECACLNVKHVWLERVPLRYRCDEQVLAKMARWIARQRLQMAQRRMENEPYKGIGFVCLFVFQNQ